MFPEPELLAAIEEAVARGVARGLREALGVRGDEAEHNQDGRSHH